MIPQKNLSKISNDTVHNGRRVPESVIERDYCIAWLLVGLSHFPLKSALAFKGGTALRRCYFKDYRFSEDLDFTLIEDKSLETLLEMFGDVFAWVKSECGVLFHLARKEPDGECSHTVYFSYEGPIPGRPREIKVDITFSEIIVTKVEEKKIIKTYDEYLDLPDSAHILVYSLSEIVVEKIAALTDPARCEPRDLFDLHFLIDHVEFTFLADNIKEKITYKGDELQNRKGNFEKKEQRLSRQWKMRLGHQMTKLPEFEGVFRSIRRVFRQMNLF